MISGILASPGIALGKAFVLQEERITVNEQKIKKKNIQYEINNFQIAKKKTIQQIYDIKNKSKKKFSSEQENIFAGHIMILEDTEFELEILNLIQNKYNTADHAVQKTINNQITEIQKLNNEYLKNRAIDIKDIGNRLLKNILNVNTNNFTNIQEKVILIAQDLTPSETAQMNFKYIQGFVTELGGETAHTSIMARALEIPAIVGIKNITKKITHGDFIILDGIKNEILINPNEYVIKTFKKKQKYYLDQKQKLHNLKNLSATTIDNHNIEISANVSNTQDIINAKKYGAESIGLYRTEFLFMGRMELPSEEEQFHAYKQAAQTMEGKTVIIRTMDIGGDKEIPYMQFPKEENPFLGWRAIRISLDKKDILHTQIKAILRASVFGKLKILFPMIISVEEIRILKDEIKKIKYILNKKKISFDPHIKIGIMIETPASAILAEYLIQEVDFFSIGTNDLTQYTLAVDRRNELISHLYEPLSPSVLKLIQNVINVAHKFNKCVGMCGELAGNTKATILLIGMGLDKFSMNASSIPKVKKIIRNITFKNAFELSSTVLQQNTSNKIIKLINHFNISI